MVTNSPTVMYWEALPCLIKVIITCPWITSHQNSTGENRNAPAIPRWNVIAVRSRQNIFASGLGSQKSIYMQRASEEDVFSIFLRVAVTSMNGCRRGYSSTGYIRDGGTLVEGTWALVLCNAWWSREETSVSHANSNQSLSRLTWWQSRWTGRESCSHNTRVILLFFRFSLCNLTSNLAGNDKN